MVPTETGVNSAARFPAAAIWPAAAVCICSRDGSGVFSTLAGDKLEIVLSGRDGLRLTAMGLNETAAGVVVGVVAAGRAGVMEEGGSFAEARVSGDASLTADGISMGVGSDATYP